MSRAFNTAGPCRPDLNYMLPPLARLPDVGRLVDQQHYFVIHAPRQTGKTTAGLQLAADLTASGRYAAALLTVEAGEPFDTLEEAEPPILDVWRSAASWQLPPELRPPPWPEAQPGARFERSLGAWAQQCPRPLVVFLDEADSLRPQVLASLLRQLRGGFAGRGRAFPWSLALIGMRDVRDDALASGGSGRRGAGSPFNVKSESILLRNFSRDEVEALYRQHTEDTGQPFTDEAVDRAHRLTNGQPWLVNALARQCVEVLVPQPSVPVEASHIEAAREMLIQRRDTHLDSLAERLREPRVRRVIEPMLAGGTLGDLASDDVRYVIELGLVRQRDHGGLDVANPIYREVIPRALAETAQYSLPHLDPVWLTPDGHLDEDALLDAFLAFWRRHGDPLLRAAPYHEIAPHLVLMAFMHRVVNGGGTIEREYAIGAGRMDLCVRHRDTILAIELEVRRPGEPDPLRDGLEQLDAYLAGLGLDRGWLVVFDRRPDAGSAAERTRTEAASTANGRAVTVVRA